MQAGQGKDGMLHCIQQLIRYSTASLMFCLV